MSVRKHNIIIAFQYNNISIDDNLWTVVPFKRQYRRGDTVAVRAPGGGGAATARHRKAPAAGPARQQAAHERRASRHGYSA